MTTHFGGVPAGSVLPVHFGSYNSDGASVALTGLAITDVEIYKGTSVTQRASDAGIALIDTDGIDIDGIAGANGFSIDTGDNTDSGFYSVGSFFNVWVSAVTIDGQTVNFLAATFRLTAAEAVAGKPKVDVDAIAGNATNATNLGTAASNYSATRGLSGTALPNAAADGAGGLPISDAGGLDLDALKAKADLIPGTMDGLTFEEATILMMAALLGKASGMGTTTGIFRAADDSKDRITATIDADGNRSAVTLDAS